MRGSNGRHGYESASKITVRPSSQATEKAKQISIPKSGNVCVRPQRLEPTRRAPTKTKDELSNDEKKGSVERSGRPTGPGKKDQRKELLPKQQTRTNSKTCQKAKSTSTLEEKRAKQSVDLPEEKRDRKVNLASGLTGERKQQQRKREFPVETAE